MQKPSKICTKTSLLYNNLYIQNTISPHSLLPLARRNAAPPFTPSPYSQNRSPCTSKQGQALSHSSGSTTPFPLRSGLRSRCPVTRHPGEILQQHPAPAPSANGAAAVCAYPPAFRRHPVPLRSTPRCS